MSSEHASSRAQGRKLIEVEDATKIYGGESGEGIVALDDVNLDVGDSEFISLVGPSGCGKTTLLRMVAGLIPATSGSVSVRGEPVTGPISDVGFVFQSSVLMDWKTVRENVIFPYKALNSSGSLDHPKAYYDERADHLLELVGLEDFTDSYPKQLSGGMQQRVAICRALLPDPPILLMDEPFGALDAFTRDKLNAELLDIWNETRKTILFVTHNVRESVYLSDRVVVLSSRPGRISSVFDVDIDRPRSLDVRDTEDFNRQVAEVRNDIEVYAQDE